jgi:hypothetical protein
MKNDLRFLIVQSNLVCTIGGGAYEAQRLKPHLVFAYGGSASPNFELDIPRQYIVSKFIMHF